MRITLPIEPTKLTAQGAGKRIAIKDGKPLFYKSKKAVSAEKAYLQLLAFHRPKKPLEGPLRVSVLFQWSFLKGDSAEDRAKGYVWHTTKPDLDNSAKMLIDCLTELGFWHDDAQIVQLSLEKTRREIPCVVIEVSQVEP